MTTGAKVRRVLMAGPEAGAPGGMRAVAETYLDNWDAAAYEVRYIGTYRDEGSKAGKLWLLLRALARYCLWLITWRPAIVHLHASQDFSYFRKGSMALLGKVAGGRVVWHSHGSQFHRYYENLGTAGGALVRFVLRRADLLIVLSAAERDYFSAIIPGARIVVLRNPYPPFPERDSLPLARRQPVILTLGRLGRRKGTYDILEAAPQVIARCPEAEFQLGGDGEVEAVRAAAGEAGLTDHFKVLGWVSGEKKEARLAEAKVFLLPSYHEGLPVAILEAMAHGLPVVTTPVGGIPEVVRDGVNGLLIPPGDPADLAAAVLRLLQDNELAERLAANAQRDAETGCSVESVLGQLYRIYGSVLES